jgi:uncharacterized membrane protein
MSHLREPRPHYTRTIKRSETIAQTLFVLGLALAIALVINSWDSITTILRALGLIGG